MTAWTLDDIDWSAFDPAAVDPDHLTLAKAAALVEANAADYAAYLANVFAGRPAIVADVRAWAEEENRHGAALARWAALADPGFDFAAAMARFRAAYAIPVDATASVRGSRVGELVARCAVEVGTSSYYTALADAATEPVFRTLCRRIAADEFRHYKLFLGHARALSAIEPLSRARRLVVALGRLAESDDDELASAWHCANETAEAPYDRRACAAAYGDRAFAQYRRRHADRAVDMVLKAAGFSPRGPLGPPARAVAWRLLSGRAGRTSARRPATGR